MDGRTRTTLIGFLAAIGVLVVLFSLVGVGEIIRVLSRANPLVVAVIPLVVVVWLVSWGLLLRVVLGVIDGQVSPTTAVFVYTAAVFANNVTPFGQAGGEPVSAYLIATAADTEYETGLAAIASVDAIHFAPSLSLAAVGLAWVGATAALSHQLQIAALVVTGLGVAIAVLIGIVWRFRDRIETTLARLITPVAATFARYIPKATPPSQRAITTRVEGFFVAVERVATDRNRLVFAFGLSTAGWIALATILWLSLYALGHVVAFTVVLLVIPLGSIASITPLPGGLGGIDSVLAALLISFGVPVPVAGAAIIIHRSATYLLPTVIGGVVASVLGVRSTASIE